MVTLDEVLRDEAVEDRAFVHAVGVNRYEVPASAFGVVEDELDAVVSILHANEAAARHGRKDLQQPVTVKDRRALVIRSPS